MSSSEEVAFQTGFGGGQVSTVPAVFGVAAAVHEALTAHTNPIEEEGFFLDELRELRGSA